jgi:hypothetical protein
MHISPFFNYIENARSMEVVSVPSLPQILLEKGREFFRVTSVTLLLILKDVEPPKSSLPFPQHILPSSFCAGSHIKDAACIVMYVYK